MYYIMYHCDTCWDYNKHHGDDIDYERREVYTRDLTEAYKHLVEGHFVNSTIMDDSEGEDE